MHPLHSVSLKPQRHYEENDRHRNGHKYADHIYYIICCREFQSRDPKIAEWGAHYYFTIIFQIETLSTCSSVILSQCL